MAVSFLKDSKPRLSANKTGIDFFDMLYRPYDRKFGPINGGYFLPNNRS
jgi:hypothetical protein